MNRKYVILSMITIIASIYGCQTAMYKTEYYASGKKFGYGKAINGKKEGLWLQWYEEGQKQGEYLYTRDRLNGPSTQWFRSGKIQTLAKYKNGDFIDTLKVFFSNGKPNYIKYYTPSGIQNGEFIVWHENGNISQVGHYVDGKKDGQWKTYFENGQLESVSSYRLGKEIGDWITYKVDGSISSKIAH